MLLSVVIPARNEAGCLSSTATAVVAAVLPENIPHEILVVGITKKWPRWPFVPAS